MGITSTSRNTIRSMELDLNRFHYPTAGITGVHSNHGGSRPIHKDGTLYRSPNKCDPKDVANVFLREVWKLHGLPTEIISDMDAKFSGEFWESLCKLLRIKRKMSTAYHPQTDGQTERTNQVLEGYLRHFVNYDQDDWDQLLPLAEFAYNNSATNAHGMSPFFANYGYHPQTE